MVNRMRHNRSQRGSTRSHHALKGMGLTVCPDCKAPVARHKVCANCGKYKGRVVINMEPKKKLEKKTEKKTKAKK